MQYRNPNIAIIFESNPKPKNTIKATLKIIHLLNEIFYPTQIKNPFVNDDDSLVDQDEYPNDNILDDELIVHNFLQNFILHLHLYKNLPIKTQLTLAIILNPHPLVILMILLIREELS